MFWTIKQIIEKFFLRLKWRFMNKHNQTNIANVFNLNAVSVGRGTYGPLYVMNFNTSERLMIGDYCSIGPKVAFMLNAEHRMDLISTYPFRVKSLHSDSFEGASKGDIIVDDDVWIGYGAIILSGVHIGQGAVIAAGAVVSSDVPPYAIVGGVPAKVIKYRFSDELIEELLEVNYSKLTREMIVKHEKELYSKLVEIKQLEWLPKK